MEKWFHIHVFETTFTLLEKAPKNIGGEVRCSRKIYLAFPCEKSLDIQSLYDWSVEGGENKKKQRKNNLII